MAIGLSQNLQKNLPTMQGVSSIKGNMDLELALDAMELVDRIDHYMLFSGDGDYRRLVEALQRKGAKVPLCPPHPHNPL